MKNPLVRAAHNLTLPEMRLIKIGLSKVNSRKVYRIGDMPMSRVTAAEYAEIAECDMSTAYQALQDAAKHLFDRKITMYTAAHNRKGQPIKSIRTDMRWVGEARYHEGEGWVELHWWHRIIEFISGIERHFTEYQLSQAVALRSVYSWRLLELVLAKFEDTGWAEYTIEDFCMAMEATEKQSSDFAKIRTKIIEPAVKELTEKGDWLIDWKPIKAGRRVAKVRFEFKRNPQGRLL
ncbi:replication initiation protein [Salmonella enterica subsp. enterica serovar Braenderup]|nr:replication initiation protein [Salmonella enterica subsp. enterica serovar Braenderup]